MSIKVKALTDQYCWYVATEDGTILATPTTLTELHEAVEGLVDVEVDTSGGFAYSESLINSLKNAAKAGTAWVKPLADGAFGVTTYDWSYNHHYQVFDQLDLAVAIATWKDVRWYWPKECSVEIRQQAVRHPKFIPN